MSPAKIAVKIEEIRKYAFKDGWCFVCGEKLKEESSTGILHYDCAHAYNDLKEEIVNRIYKEYGN